MAIRLPEWLVDYAVLFLVAAGAAAALICAPGCASYNDEQLQSFEATTNKLLEAAQALGIEADAELKWGGEGAVGGVWTLDLGTQAAIWLRARPGEVTAADILDIANKVLDGQAAHNAEVAELRERLKKVAIRAAELGVNLD